MRERYLAEREARYRQSVYDVLRAFRASPDERREMAREKPKAVAVAVIRGEEWELLDLLDDSALEALLDGDVPTVPFTALSEEWQARARSCREENRRWDDVIVYYQRHPWLRTRRLTAWVEIPSVDPKALPAEGTIARFRPEVSWAWLAFQYGQALGMMQEVEPPPGWDPEQHAKEVAEASAQYEKFAAFERDYGINIRQKARAHIAAKVPAWAQPERRPKAPAPSRKLVPVSLGRGASIGYGELPLLLLDLAERLDFNLVSACYWTASVGSHRIGSGIHWDRRYPCVTDEEGHGLVDANPAYTLNRICKEHAYGWVEDGGFFRVHDLLWFVDDATEVPASVLNEWAGRTDNEKDITLEDYLYLVRNLTFQQAFDLISTAYRGEPTVWGEEEPGPLARAQEAGQRHYYPFRLYSLLPTELREKAEASGIHIETELPQELLEYARMMLEQERLVHNPPFRGRARHPEAVDEILAESRLWARYGRSEDALDSVTEKRGPMRWFRIELWSSGEPDWTDPEASGELVGSWGVQLVSERGSSPSGGASGRSQEADR